MAYYGIYRAKVVQREDERQKGRIKVVIPDISGSKGKSQWVDLCMNCAYENGGDIAVPKLGDTCWIMFEKGDLNLPVYMGNFFGAFKTPLPDYDEDTRVISWDNCRIEMKGDTMKFIVGEKSLITITTDSISLEVGENSEGKKPTGHEDSYYNDGKVDTSESSESGDSGGETSSGEPSGEGETSSGGTSSSETPQETSSSDAKSGKSSIVLTTKIIGMNSTDISEEAEKNISLSAGGNISLSAKKSASISGLDVDITAKTMASMKATAEVGLMGLHIGLNDVAAKSAMKSVSVSSVLTSNTVLQSLGKAAIKGIISGDVMGELTGAVMGQITALGTQTLNSMLDKGINAVLDNPVVSSALDKVGSLGEILSPNTLTNLISDTKILGAFGGIDNLNSILGTSKFSDLINFPDIVQGFTGSLTENLLPDVASALKLDTVLQDNLGIDIFGNMSLTDAISAIPEVKDVLSLKGSVADVFSDAGIDRLSKNGDFVSQVMTSNFNKLISGDEDFEGFDASKRIQELSDQIFAGNKS